MRQRRSLIERAAVKEMREAESDTLDVSKGRWFNPLTPQRDGLSRIMITHVPMIHSETGEAVDTYHVDYFNCENAQAAAELYQRGKVAVETMRKENARPEPL